MPNSGQAGRRAASHRNPSSADPRSHPFLGAHTSAVLGELQRYESRNVTFVAPDGAWPIVWERARGMHVWDVEGRRYLDLTAAFGVTACGHANPCVVRAGQQQMARLGHAMGDVHPHALKAHLARELSRLTFERWNRTQPASERTHGKTIFCNSGFEAVEAALKTARLLTQRPGVVAFSGAYHGLGYGALNATHRELFRAPFRDQLGGFGRFVPFPLSDAEVKAALDQVARCFRRHPTGAVLIEPIQGRGGNRVPPARFLPALRQLCRRHDVLLILDEIYTGLGRTGAWFACEHWGVVPDLICLGKALTGGFPLSACVGRAGLMDRAWPESAGEALHTSTYLGHPVGCAMALAQIKEIRARRLVTHSKAMGRHLQRRLAAELPRAAAPLHVEVRGLGLMAGVALTRMDGSPAGAEALDIVRHLLHRGFILLPEGEHGNVLSLTPPLIVRRAELDRTVDALARVMKGRR